MPYIKIEDRERYTPLVIETVQAIMSGNDARLVKGEFFGYWMNRVVKGYMCAGDIDAPSFNSSLFNLPKKKLLTELAVKTLVFLNKDDPLDSAGELNYVISTVLWGVLGDAEGIEKANYGWRTYLKGICNQVVKDMERAVFPNTEQKQRLMNFRRFLVSYGVVTDIIDETYRQHTAPYENHKIDQNGTLWEHGKLVGMKCETTPAVVKKK